MEGECLDERKKRVVRYNEREEEKKKMETKDKTDR